MASCCFCPGVKPEIDGMCLDCYAKKYFLTPESRAKWRAYNHGLLQRMDKPDRKKYRALFNRTLKRYLRTLPGYKANRREYMAKYCAQPENKVKRKDYLKKYYARLELRRVCERKSTPASAPLKHCVVICRIPRPRKPKSVAV